MSDRGHDGRRRGWFARRKVEGGARLARTFLWLSVLVAWTAPASPASVEDVRIVMHRKDPPADPGTICTIYTPNADGLPCSAYVTHGPAPGESLIYFMVVHAPEVGVIGADFGIDYNGRSGTNEGADPSSATFTLCTDGLAFTYGTDFNMDGSVTPDEEFPAPLGGVAITSVTCWDTTIGGEGVYAVLGAMSIYAYSEDVIEITPANNFTDGARLDVRFCNNTESELLRLHPQQYWQYLMGRVELGGDGSQGYACVALPVKTATWGKVKALYREQGR